MSITPIYVDSNNVQGPGDGKQWTTAFQTIQQGINAAAKTGGEVWVATGTYKPTATTDRTIAIRLKPAVALYGGFEGTETGRDQRDWIKHETILSGNLDGTENIKTNALHVVIGANDAVIDGFTIRDGYNVPEGPPPHHMSPQLILESKGNGTGAAILNFMCAPIVRNCLIKDNYAAKGAGIYNMVTPSWPPPKTVQPAPTVINCTFARNYSRGRGGAVSNDLMTHPTFIDCTFIDNTCDGKGGGMYNDFNCSPTLISCVFAQNTAMKGGGMANDGLSAPLLTNCTFTQNHARDMYGGLYNGTGPTNTGNNPIVSNCIFWGNTAHSGPKEIGRWHGCVPVVTYSCVEGGYDGEGNINADPLFVNPAGGDFHLGAASPCIDAANGAVAPVTDRDGNPRYDDKGWPTGPLARVPLMEKDTPPPVPSTAAEFPPPADMGAYERQTDSIRGEPVQVVYVNATNVDGPWDGNSWATAYCNLQVALTDAYTRAKEVWVAAGTYKPTATSDRRISFKLKAGLAVYGGFKGLETKRDQRDWGKNVTILSGRIGRPQNGSENSYHVLVGAAGAIIDGFTINHGNADGDGFYNHGGGMVNYNNSSPQVANCIFSRNKAVEGGAMYNYNLSSPTLINCIFKANLAAKGGAMVNRVGASPGVTKCTFVQNLADWRGGALLIDYGSGPKLANCIFKENTSSGHGGAAFLESVAAQLGIVRTHFDKCTFIGNEATLQGGGMANSDGGNPLLTDCTFTQNHAGKGGGGLSNHYHVSVTLDNCTFVENFATEGQADIETDETSVVKQLPDLEFAQKARIHPVRA